VSEAGRSRTVVFTGLALTAFAANSLLCRSALGRGAIDAASFSTIRLAAGAAALLAILRVTRPRDAAVRGSWLSAALLFLYAVPFSYAYVTLGAGTGALILFGSVQATMLAVALFTGERPHPVEWTGLVVALSGLVYLVLPGLSAPSPVGCALMTTAGMAWGAYSIRGRGASNPLAETTGNFLRSVPLAVAVSLVAARSAGVTAAGAVLAILSGVLASGLGYVAWYAALSGLTATRAASVQLAVPVLAAAGGVAFLSERITVRLVASAVLILGGVGLALTRTGPRRPPRPQDRILRAKHGAETLVWVGRSERGRSLRGWGSPLPESALRSRSRTETACAVSSFSL
jgi:drug/metabolite transporter (DMT)-like permease